MSESEFPASMMAQVEEVTTTIGAVMSPSAPKPKARRGFAAMSAEKQRELAARGGRASHKKGTGYEWNSEAARAAGRKGGLASRGGKSGPKNA